jgi:hypothetical protein
MALLTIAKVFPESPCGSPRVQGRMKSSLAKVIEDTMGAAQRQAMFAMFEQMVTFHPREAHWHLPLFGLDLVH